MKPVLLSRKAITFFILLLLLLLFLSLSSRAQGLMGSSKEVAFCVIKAGEKTHQLTSNYAGYFDRISSLPPLSSVLIELTYPSAQGGEKVAVSVEDGGILEGGEQVKALTLDKAKKASFRFQLASPPGLYRLLLRKGPDTKIIQFWVGNTPAATRH